MQIYDYYLSSQNLSSIMDYFFKPKGNAVANNLNFKNNFFNPHMQICLGNILISNL